MGTESKTEEWSESVTVTVQQGWSLDGNAGSASISSTIGHKTANTYSNEWSTSTEHDFSVSFGKEDVGKAAWQFRFSPKDSCGHTEETLTKEFALPENAAREPCCVPGYATDAPAYKTCTSQDVMVKGGLAAGCSVA